MIETIDLQYSLSMPEADEGEETVPGDFSPPDIESKNQAELALPLDASPWKKGVDESGVDLQDPENQHRLQSPTESVKSAQKLIEETKTRVANA